jgi:phage head maturation protease
MLTTLQALKVRFPQAIAVQRTYKRGASVSSNRTINLLCAPYNGAAANLGGGLFEAYGPSCFRDGLTQNDLRVLHNHSETQSQVLGRVSAGTCRFWDAADGVHAIVPDPPNTTWCNDLIESMRRKEVTDSSAAFWIVEQHFEARNGNRTRVIDRAIMHDASCEAWGAYGAAAPATVSSGANFDMSTPAGRLRARISLQEMRLKSCQSWEESEIRRKIIDLMRERVS